MNARRFFLIFALTAAMAQIGDSHAVGSRSEYKNITSLQAQAVQIDYAQRFEQRDALILQGQPVDMDMDMDMSLITAGQEEACFRLHGKNLQSLLHVWSEGAETSDYRDEEGVFVPEERLDDDDECILCFGETIEIQ